LVAISAGQTACVNDSKFAPEILAGQILTLTPISPLAGDSIGFSVSANVFGTLTFVNGATTATVTAVTVATAADFAALATAVQAGVTGGAALVSTAAANGAQVLDVTVSADNLAGRYVILADTTAGISLAPAGAGQDTIISITGATGALNAQDIFFF